MCEVKTVADMEEKKEEANVALRAERETVLAGMQATGSIAAYSMMGGPQIMSGMSTTDC